MTNLIRCSKCLTPETHETISFDNEGVCNICRQNQYKKEKINWEKRETELNEILEEHRKKYDYDCIVPFSGGKDSTFTLLEAGEGLRPGPGGILRPRLSAAHGH